MEKQLQEMTKWACRINPDVNSSIITSTSVKNLSKKKELLDSLWSHESINAGVLTGKGPNFDIFQEVESVLSPAEKREYELQKKLFDQLFLYECPLCGNEIIEDTYTLFDIPEKEKESWGSR